MAGSKGSKYYDVYLDYSIFLKRRGSNELVLSQEQIELLLLVDELQSITASARQMCISYRKAWELVRQSEQSLGFTIISKSRGGKNGGSSVLTPDGKLLANAYRQLQADFNSSVKRVVKEFFQTINR